jgi:Protein of unknown function (DUF3631)
MTEPRFTDGDTEPPRPAESDGELLEEQDGPTLLSDTVSYVRKWVTLSEAQAIVVALWAVHTHIRTSGGGLLFRMTPYLAVTSAELRSGKSQLLTVLSYLCAAPRHMIEPTAAVAFRLIEKERPTLLIDEGDATFAAARGEDGTESLRGLFNSGDRAGASVVRCVGRDHEPRTFATFCPKAFAAIGKLPTTIADRSVPLRLRRRKPSERGFRFITMHADEGKTLQARIGRWAEDNMGDIISKPLSPLDSLQSDRLAEGVAPLLVIADTAGGGWGERLRAALVEVVEGVEPEVSLGVRLLEDIRSALGDSDRLSMEDLLSRLIGMAESPWGTLDRGRPMTVRRLSRMLADHDVRSRSVRLPDGSVPKGYLRTDFEDAFERYLTIPRVSFSHTVTTADSIGQNPLFASVTDPLCDRTKNTVSPNNDGPCDRVTEANPVEGEAEPAEPLLLSLEDGSGPADYDDAGLAELDPDGEVPF